MTSSSKIAGPVTSTAEAQTLVGRLCDVTDALLATIKTETDFVRSGQLVAATQLEKKKAELASLYLADAERIKSNIDFFNRNAPGLLDRARERHRNFHALLQINLTVLATAHAVSESLIRGAAGEVARKSAPQVYGASGRTAAPPRNAIAPVALSRTL